MEENKNFIEFIPHVSLNAIDAIQNPSDPSTIAQYRTENGIVTTNPFTQEFIQDFTLEQPTDNIPSRITPEQANAEHVRWLASQLKLSDPTETVNNPASKYNYNDILDRMNKSANSSAKKIIEEINGLDLSTEDKEYLLKLAKRESDFRPTVVNRYGYSGLYQFGDSTLRGIGMSKNDYMNSTLKQHQAALDLAKANERTLMSLAQPYIGKEFRGVKVTRNGIRAAAHLLGAGTVRDWFNNTTNTKLAKNGFVDGNKTHITEYFNLFA